MTCEDCYHYEACKEKFAGLRKICVENPEKHLELDPRAEIVCQQFKDKLLIIELPCKVGKEIYVLNRENIPQRMILDEPDIRCHCAKEDNLCMALCDDKKHGICAYRLKNDGSDIGKKVFRTNKEAEARSKELNNENSI
mgnify:FL=1